MRYILAALLSSAIAAPAAFAAPAPKPQRASVSQPAPIAPAAHRKHAQSQTRGHARGLGGIHPLVGSGDY